jgi:hypothetical protein
MTEVDGRGSAQGRIASAGGVSLLTLTRGIRGRAKGQSSSERHGQGKQPRPP